MNTKNQQSGHDQTQNSKSQALFCRSSVFIVCVLLLGLTIATTAKTVGVTHAYLQGTAEAKGVSFQSGLLDFDLTGTHYKKVPVESQMKKGKLNTVVSQHPKSIALEYTVFSEFTGGNKDFCNNIEYEIAHNKKVYTEKQNKLSAFRSATTSKKKPWKFKKFTLSDQAPKFQREATCNIDFIFLGWHDGAVNPNKVGFTHKESITLQLTNKTKAEQNPRRKRPSDRWMGLYTRKDYQRRASRWYLENSAGSSTLIRTRAASTSINKSKGWIIIHPQEKLMAKRSDFLKLKDSQGEILEKYSVTSEATCRKRLSSTTHQQLITINHCRTGVPIMQDATLPHSAPLLSEIREKNEEQTTFTLLIPRSSVPVKQRTERNRKTKTSSTSNAQKKATEQIQNTTTKRGALNHSIYKRNAGSAFASSTLQTATNKISENSSSSQNTTNSSSSDTTNATSTTFLQDSLNNVLASTSASSSTKQKNSSSSQLLQNQEDGDDKNEKEKASDTSTSTATTSTHTSPPTSLSSKNTTDNKEADSDSQNATTSTSTQP